MEDQGQTIESEQEKPFLSLTPEMMEVVKTFAKRIQTIPDVNDRPRMVVWIKDLLSHIGVHSNEIRLKDIIYWLQTPEFRELFTLESESPESETILTPAPSSSNNTVGDNLSEDADPAIGNCVNANPSNDFSNQMQAPKKRKKSELEFLLESNTYGVDCCTPRKRLKVQKN
ncbi:unnamed protein product [Orchesella dallaii]|uniref:DUF4485 domain-containing protein n=1 Tax=Orchesella dallaii TaxID=48710 RepID=A0ABP1QW83_9HEXA